jgi:transposase-like protein
VDHRQHRYLSNRAENSHQPTRQQERRLQGSNRLDRPSVFSPPRTSGSKWTNMSGQMSITLLVQGT